MGRRWGKTLMSGSICLACAWHGAAVAWVVPTYRNARPLWRFAEQHAAGHADLLRAEMTVRFGSRGHLTIYTAENDVAMRGESFDLVVVDECARIAETTYTDVIIPTLADRDGRAILISTPKGRNWFWREWEAARRDGRYAAAFTAPTSANPLPSIQHAFRLARERLSERTFRQEWLAEFVEDGGGVFRRVRELSTLPRLKASDGAEYVIGVDWGRSNDETVCSVWEIQSRREVALDRYTGVPFGVQYQRVAALAAEYHDALVIAEANSQQDAHVEQLARLGLRVMPWITTQASKLLAVERLAGALERGEVALQSDEEGILQMEAYESTRTPGGLLRYAAPEGMHDDIPMARMIAYSLIGQDTKVLLE